MKSIRSPFSVVSFAVYDKATGAIRRSGRVHAKDIDAQPVAVDEGLIEGDFDFQTAYVDLSGVEPVGKIRPDLKGFDRLSIKADSADAAIMDLPVKGIVTIDGHSQKSEPEDLHFTADSPGNYRIEIEAFPYMPYAVTIAAS